MKSLTPEQRQKHLKTIEKIEGLKRPDKWIEIRKFLFELHPEFVQVDRDFCQAVKELRDQSEKTAASKSLAMRNTMKIPTYVYEAIRKLDGDIAEEMSGTRNTNYQHLIGKQLYDAFPMYRVARKY